MSNISLHLGHRHSQLVEGFAREVTSMTRLTMDLEKCNIEKSRQKEDYNKLMQDFNGLQVRALTYLLACTYLPGNRTSP